MRIRFRTLLPFGLSSFLVGCGVVPDARLTEPGSWAPTAGLTPQFSIEAARPKRDLGISYHGGPLMLGTVNVYYVWYGDWSGNTAVPILTNLASSVGGSPRYAINTAYFDSSGQRVSNSVAFGGAQFDTGSRGLTIQDTDIPLIVSGALASSQLPSDENGVYFVLTAPNVAEISGFGRRYYAYHSAATIGGKTIKYAFVGNPDSLANPVYLQAVSPNGNPGADHMASGIVHELEEAATDPVHSSWFDEFGFENADKAAYTYGPTIALPSGARYNLTLGGTNYLIQQNWLIDATGGHQALDLTQVSTLNSSDARSTEQTLTSAITAYQVGNTSRAVRQLEQLESLFRRQERAGKITAFDLDGLIRQTDNLIVLFQTHQY